MNRIYLILFLAFISQNILSQQEKSLLIKKTKSVIEIDGVLDETVWGQAQVASGFTQNFPADTSEAISRTEAMITFDDDNIYIAAVCYDDNPEKEYTIQSLKRDFSYPVSDAFAVYFDPFNDKTNGFSFAVNPFGVQREGLLQNGGSFGVTTAWDNKWFSEVKIYKDRWVVEMKIPFKSIRYNSDQKEWGVNFSRNNLKINENSAWSRIPRNYNIGSLAFTGAMHWEEQPKKAGANVSIIPYAITGGKLDYENDTTTQTINAGLDAKIAVTSSLNLDLTINPDFSQVEVDVQVTNLSRFSLFFPERRQFFVENSDLFERFGFSKIRPFFSRRIGLNNGVKVPILGGARLSGKVNENWRIGFMNMQTGGVESLDLEAQNYTVGVFQRQIGKMSNIGGIVVNRIAFDESSVNYADYNRVVGLDYNLATKKNHFTGKAFFHHSFSPLYEDYTHASWLMYNVEKITAHWNHEYVGKDYRADVGFVPRISQYNTELEEYVYSTYWRIEPSFMYRIYPKSPKIVFLQPGVYWSNYYDAKGNSTERLNFADFKVSFTDKSEFKLVANQNEVLLQFDTDVTFSGNTSLDSGRYTFNYVDLSYNSSSFKRFKYTLSANYGEYYIGNKITANASLSYRTQPWGNFSLSARYDKIDMPDGFDDVSLWLVGPRFDLSFTKKLFFTTFIQYNTQIENVNINARFQYRFKPMSDLYIVYTDNYNSNIMGVKNRAVVVKFIYWLNL